MALADNRITDNERTQLRQIQDSLGISHGDANRIFQQVLADAAASTADATERADPDGVGTQNLSAPRPPPGSGVGP